MNHMKKMIAPIIVGVIILMIYIGYFCVAYFGGFPWYVLLIAGLILLAATCVVVYVVVERIKEIRSGEEDDLSKY